MNIVATSDFTGVYKISTDNFSGLSDYITEFEPLYLRAVLGDENASVIDGLVSLTTKYDELINGVTYTNTNSDVKTNKGLKSALIAFIYFHYVSDVFINTAVGNVRKLNENSTNTALGVNAQITANRFNTGALLVLNDVIPFMTNYNTLDETATASSEVAGAYTVSIPSTKYLSVGDIVTIDNIEYTLTGVNANVSIQFTTTVGMDFTNKLVVWQPFFNSNGNAIDLITL